MDDPREAARLATKVDARTWVTRYLAEHLEALPTGARVLDVGCGQGVLLAEVARRRPDLEAIAVDASDDRVAVAARHLEPYGAARAVCARAEALPVAAGSVDLVWCRFVLEYLPTPATAVAELLRVCRPGGVLVLQDLDGQLVQHHPPDPELDAELRIVLDAIGTRLDPYVGRKLFSLLAEAGARDLRVDAEAYHLIAGRASPDELRLWEVNLDSAFPTICSAVGYPRAEAFVDRFLGYLRCGHTLTFSTMFTVTGRAREVA